MYRRDCVLCGSCSLNDIFTLANYPITPSSSNLEASTDEFQDCTFAGCADCGCIQLKTLIDPIKLYSNSHNSTEETPTWKEHHHLFANFIGNNTHEAILEIGGNSGILYKLLSPRIPQYTIMDICDSETRPAEVRFIQGNCEQYDFTGHTCVALSHTFEHLYNPRSFIQNLYNARVNSVFISIPNMDHLYSSENISLLHNEHTFFVGDNEIKLAFLQMGYACKVAYDFRSHSRFYHFIYNTGEKIPCQFPQNMSRITGFQNTLTKYDATLKSLEITMPFFICPAGHYGQKIYYYLQRFGHYMKGFIDNDKSKQHKRVYGTPAYVYSPDILTRYRDNPICVILYAGPYTEELKAQLNLLHTSIQYIAI